MRSAAPLRRQPRPARARVQLIYPLHGIYPNYLICVHLFVFVPQQNAGTIRTVCPPSFLSLELRRCLVTQLNAQYLLSD